LLLTICTEDDEVLETIPVEVLPRIGEQIAFSLRGNIILRIVKNVVHHYFWWQQEEEQRSAAHQTPARPEHRYYAIVDGFGIK
jgi:hypothetical protein